ncbi:hypothetical protein CHARACLAT_025954, partial [Characodon lateralis]|nr:hypothetical protein [Characodon lateralis]
ESSSPSLLSPDNSLERSFFIRMKSTLTKRGVHIKSSGYKVIHITGRLRIRMALTHTRSVPNQIMGMVVVAHALPPPTINEVRIDCQMFVTRVNMDLKIVYCENRISDYMDLTPVDIVGRRCYQFIHAEDVEGIRQSHLDSTRRPILGPSCDGNLAQIPFSKTSRQQAEETPQAPQHAREASASCGSRNSDGPREGGHITTLPGELGPGRSKRRDSQPEPRLAYVVRHIPGSP